MRLWMLLCPLCETNKLCVHAQSPLGVGACVPCSLSQTGAPWLPRHYPRSSLVWAPPTSHHFCFRPRCSGLSGSALARQRWDLLGYCLFSLSGSVRPSIPGGRGRLALAPVTLLPAGVLKPSALSNAVIAGLNTFTVGVIRYHCSSPAFVPTHQVHCCQRTCKARYPARG
jgi:hypothetical protein